MKDKLGDEGQLNTVCSFPVLEISTECATLNLHNLINTNVNICQIFKRNLLQRSWHNFWTFPNIVS